MSERRYKVEQWSPGFLAVIRVLLEAQHPEDAHGEFDRVVRRRPRGWYTVRWGVMVMREHVPTESPARSMMTPTR